ncbi:MAG TPA: hypothetical protein VNE40_01260 [Candidatus Dormibacteraeota bacterium]|nr:hypothetical protein [Candidatus Dormibacteraeota bacterium]
MKFSTRQKSGADMTRVRQAMLDLQGLRLDSNQEPNESRLMALESAAFEVSASMLRRDGMTSVPRHVQMKIADLALKQAEQMIEGGHSFYPISQGESWDAY